MFCQNCGTQIQPGQQFCSKCAMPLVGYAPPQKWRLQRHIHLLGILWIAYSALHLLGGLVLMIVANTIFGHMGRFETGAPAFLQPLLSAIGILVLIKGILGIAAGWGLMQHLDWARVLAIVLAFISLFNPPFGTALGIYTLWILLSRGADAEYRALAQGASG
jgi:hypothetical protein